MTDRILTAAAIRDIVQESGLAHAEFVIEQAESQLGRDALKAARAEWQRLADKEPTDIEDA